jgi:hypothetical protein
MQRLGDIVARDLDFIMNEFMDFTEEITIQCGKIKKVLNGSLQSDSIEFTADVSPLNAFSVSLYYIEPNDPEFNRAMVKNAIIFVNNVSYKIIDSTLTRGLRVLSLEKHGGR